MVGLAVGALVLLISIWVTKGVQINPQIGSIIHKRNTVVNAAAIKFNIIVKLDEIPELPLTDYPSPCDYLPQALMSLGDQFDINHHRWTIEYKQLCKGYEKIRNMYMNLRGELQLEEQVVNTSIVHFRQKRFIGRTFRKLFGIGHLKRQKQLTRAVNNLGSTAFQHEGQIKGLMYLTKSNDDNIRTLRNATLSYSHSLRELSIFVNNITQIINNRELMTRHTMTFIQDVLICGVLNNELLDLHNQVLRERLRGLATLTSHRLSPELISPQTLKNTLSKLQTKLQSKYRQLRLSDNVIHDFYARDNVLSHRQNGSTYISIPVTLEVMSELYQLYEIETFPLPIHNRSQATIITDTVDLIAVNNHHYFTVKHHVLDEHCHGKTIKTCNRLFVSHDFIHSPSCESSLYKNDLKNIKKLCNIGIMQFTEYTIPMVFDLYNNSILLINPTGERIYSQCLGKRKKYLTKDCVVTINQECFCQILNDKMNIPLFAEQTCVEDQDLQVSVIKHMNLMYIAYMLNSTLENIHDHLNDSIVGQIPKIVIPDFLETINIPSQSNTHIYDLQKVINLQNNAFGNTLHGRVQNNAKEIRGFGMFKICSYITITLVIFLFVVWILLSCKLKSLGKLLSIGKMIPVSSGYPLNKDLSDNTTNYWHISFEIMYGLILVLAIIYWIYNHITLIKKMLKYCAFPIKEFDLNTKQPSLTVLLYFSSVNDWCYVHIDELYALPHEIKLRQSQTNIEVSLHEGCCSSYVTINHQNLSLELQNNPMNSFVFNKTVSVPAYSNYALKKILSSEFKLQVLVGENKIYRAFDVVLTTHHE